VSLFAYLPHPDFQKELETELSLLSKDLFFSNPHFFVTEKLFQPAWSQQCWMNCQVLDISSIQNAQLQLKEIGGFWIPYSFQLHRRTQLIAEKIPLFKNKKIIFGEIIPQKKVHCFTLLEKNKLLVSQNIFPQYPGGILEFNEDKQAPSRAYLKLWETFSLYASLPKKNDKVVDLGSCPGGWTYVLAKTGCEVISVDTAPIDKKILEFPNVHYLKKDAFQLNPNDLGKIDWLFSDIICDPAKLLQLIEKWMKSNLVKNFVCTIKFKGKTNFDVIHKLKKIPNSKIIHLSCNKHELTWIKLA